MGRVPAVDGSSFVPTKENAVLSLRMYLRHCDESGAFGMTALLFSFTIITCIVLDGWLW